MMASVLVLVTLASRDPDDLSHEVRERHLRALRAAGLTPVAVAGSASQSELAEVLDACGAAYLPGTDHVPARLGEDGAEGAAAAGMTWDPWKVRADLAVLRLAWERRVPVLGVCGGMQAMAILAGGTLRLRDDDAHRSVAADHAVALEPGSLAADAFATTRVAANSFHRQVVERAPAGLVVSGRARVDGTVEALEADRAVHPFWLGVQWHPELRSDPRPFTALARAAGVSRSRDP